MKDYPAPVPASSPQPLHKQYNDPISERSSKFNLPLPTAIRYKAGCAHSQNSNKH